MSLDRFASTIACPLLLLVVLVTLWIAPGTWSASGARALAVARIDRDVPGAHVLPAESPQSAPHQNVRIRTYLPLLVRQWSSETGGLGDPYGPTMGNAGYDVVRYNLSFTLALTNTTQPAQPVARAEVVAEIDARSTKDGLERVSLDFVPATASEVQVDGQRAGWYNGPASKLWVALPRKVAVGESFQLRIHYALVSGGGGGLNVGRVGQSDLRVWTPAAASAWFPSNDYPSDRAEFQFRITAPKPYIGVANGRPTGQSEADGATTTTYLSHVGFMPSDATMQVAKFTAVDRTSRTGVTLRHYVTSPTEQLQPMLRTYERQLDFFATHFGGYPFETFGVVESGANNFQAASLVAVAPNQLTRRPVDLERDGGNIVARQWIGSAIGSNRLADGWMVTGLDAYLGMLYPARDQGPEIVRARLAGNEWSYAFTAPADFALAELPPGAAANVVRNTKPPAAFHGIWVELGQAGFWQMLRDYYGQRLGKGHQLEAMQTTSEAVAGRSLTALFDMLFRKAATPRVNLAWSQSGATLRLRVCQLTAAPIGFKMQVAVHAEDTNLAPSYAELTVQGADQVIEIPAPVGNVAAVTPDPFQELFADILMHPAPMNALPACSALPLPAQPTAAGDAPAAGNAPVAGESVDDVTTGDATTDDQDAGFGAVEHPEKWMPDSSTSTSNLSAEAYSPHEGRPAFSNSLKLDGAFAPGEPTLGDTLIPYLGNSGYDVQKYTVKVRIDPLTNRVEGDTTIDVLSTLDALDRLSLDFMRVQNGKGLEISALTVNDTPATYERPTDADKLWINLPQAVAKDQAFTIRVVYAGTTVRGGTEQFSGGLLPFQGPVMYAISEPDGTRNWIPSNDHPRDKALFHYEITVPKPFVATANGNPLGTTETMSDTTATFDMPHPMSSYLATAAVGRYRTADQTTSDGKVKLRHYFLNDPEVAMGVAGVTPDVLEVFGRLVRPYAFETYGHYAAPGFGGGMENQTMTAIGANVFTTRTPRNSHSLIAHEAAHQWFGDALSPYSWSDIWLNEGSATYFAELWRASRVGPEPLGWRMESQRYTTLSSGRLAPVSKPSVADMFGTNTYNKGGWVLHMLHEELGDTAFWTAEKQYFDSHKYGNVKTADLQASMEAASGKNLGAWFDQWVHRAGNPTLYIAWRQADRHVEARVCQPGTPFDLPIAMAPFNEESAAQERSRKGERVVRKVSGPDTLVEFDLASSGVLDGLSFDPDFQLLAEMYVEHAAGAALPTCQDLMGSAQ